MYKRQIEIGAATPAESHLRINADNLDRLIYTYLGDWIRTQEQGVKNGTDGADIRLAAAQNLQTELEAIKLGEAAKDGKSGYDIFVRWKPLQQQPIGWNPDLNDVYALIFVRLFW